ncbi:MarR family transcriptional regulator [Candidatus Peregrinibacteria bacterium]|nr:MarR family transcriptional regulator [Candidatus Peregrinibacteria bacterium]
MSSRKNPIDRLIESTYDFGRIMRQQMIGQTKTADGANLLHIHTLFLISELKGMTMKQLAESLHISSPSATSLINRLVRTGLVSRLHDEENRKLVRLRLTSSGKTILRKKHERRRQVLRRIFGLLTRSEQLELARLHEKLSTKLSSLSSH